MIPLRVMAIVIHQIVPLDPIHGRDLLLTKATGIGWRGGGREARGGPIGGAATYFEVCILTNKGLVVIINLVFSILGGPR